LKPGQTDLKRETETLEIAMASGGCGTDPWLVDEGGGDPGLAGDPGAVGDVVAEQLANERAEVHVGGEHHDDLGRGLHHRVHNALDVLRGRHLQGAAGRERGRAREREEMGYGRGRETEREEMGYGREREMVKEREQGRKLSIKV